MLRLVATCLPFLVMNVADRTSLAQNPPANISHLYEKEIDESVSDDFDARDLNEDKWGYRTEEPAGNWLASNVSIERDGDATYLNLLGRWNRSTNPNGIIVGTGSSSGIYTRQTAGFGFYTTRWRVEGINPTQRSSWHPAIWKANAKPINGWVKSDLPTDQIELDFIEFFQWRDETILWHSQAIEWVSTPKGRRQTRFQHNQWSGDFLDSYWNTHGLEYHPEYIQLWEFDEASSRWTKRGSAVTISPAKTDQQRFNINKESAHEGHWIISNYDYFNKTNEHWGKLFGRPISSDDNFLESDSSLKVDHFRFYPLVQSSKADAK